MYLNPLSVTMWKFARTRPRWGRTCPGQTGSISLQDNRAEKKVMIIYYSHVTRLHSVKISPQLGHCFMTLSFDCAAIARAWLRFMAQLGKPALFKRSVTWISQFDSLAFPLRHLNVVVFDRENSSIFVWACCDGWIRMIRFFIHVIGLLLLIERTREVGHRKRWTLKNLYHQFAYNENSKCKSIQVACTKAPFGEQND